MEKPIKPLAELLDSVRNIEGFPIGKDEDILALSNPPYYTACPNPYIKDFIEEYGKKYDEESDDYKREPYVGDVSEGKSNSVYNAHSYHTKVPHKAIMKYINHYTSEGDIVFDGFCGTGMTGIAATFLNRRAILSDISSIASFIAYNYNNKINVDKFGNEANRILTEVTEECGWMYKTNHGKQNKIKGDINYTVWSDVFICPFCGNDIVFYHVSNEKSTGAVKDSFQCSHCQAQMKKTNCKRKERSFYDEVIGENISMAIQVPVLINYSFDGGKFDKEPDGDDLALIAQIENQKIPYWFPNERMPDGDEARRNDGAGITHVHHYYTKRSLYTLGCVYNKISKADKLNRDILFFTFEQAVMAFAKICRYVPTHFSQVNQYLSGTLYIGSQIVEISLPYIMVGKIKRLKSAFSELSGQKGNNVIVSLQSSTDLGNVPDSTADYIFVDPPFGDNLMYSELNFLNEAWHKIFTNNNSEAIINKTQNKTLNEYAQLMQLSFSEFYRILKPNRWITVEFHNSKSYVWNSIQDTLTKAGFIISNVSILDKMHVSFKQITSANAVKNDLVISAYKPKASFIRQFLEFAGEGLEEEFIRMHLSHLQPEPSIERTEQMLYSKMLAYYVQRSYTVKYDASTFYKMLRNKFTEQDGYWFNSDQLPAYQEYKQKMKLEGIDEISRGMLSLFVSDEKSALIWLHAFLDTPKDFQTIHPAFHKIASISGDKVPDLREILNASFIREGDTYRRPQSEDEKLTVNQKRERELMREFEAILLEAKSSKKKIKEVRKQSLVYGFEQCYKSNRFGDILAVSKRLDRTVLENNSDITEFIEVAEMKTEGF